MLSLAWRPHLGLSGQAGERTPLLSALAFRDAKYDSPLQPPTSSGLRKFAPDPVTPAKSERAPCQSAAPPPGSDVSVGPGQAAESRGSQSG